MPRSVAARVAAVRSSAIVLVTALILGVAPGVLPEAAQAADTASAITTASARLAAAQARLADLNDQVEHAQGRVDELDRQLVADAAEQQKLSHSLDDMARFEYTQPSLGVRLLGARSVGDVFAQIQQMQLVGQRQQALLDRRKAARARDQRARDEQTALLKKVEADRAEAQEVAAQAQVALAAARTEAARQQAAAVAAQATASATVQVRTVGIGYSSPAGNHFTYGYCTWYVANRRPIPWFGNAIEWWPNARAYGYAEGSSPRPGAVMVTSESSTGHVAYVESVNPDGSWTVSEMNFVAWGVVSSRTIRPGQAPVVGFIY